MYVMRKTIITLAVILLPAALFSQTAKDTTHRWHFKINEVNVVASRPMKEIGVQKTEFDSLQLKENIALSMADILTFHSPVFVKNYGRATLSTVAFRGTSPSHTQVTWNDMKINNPMLGMTDFSTIPSYFIDDASLLHGTSSVNETGGGLGGAIKLATKPAGQDGLGIQYIQGIGSFNTYDEFLRVLWGSEKWQSSTRVVYSSSPNDYKYLNHDKKENLYDDNGNIVSQYYPVEKNKSGAYKDLHILQELYMNNGKGDRFGFNLWYFNSDRELAMLTTDYGDEREFENRQRERTLRSVVSWDHYGNNWKGGLKGGYINTWMAYDYKRDPGNGTLTSMIRSRSRINTFYGQVSGEYSPNSCWYFTAGLSAHQHFVRSEDKNIILQEGSKAVVGYDKGRIELSGNISAKWKPSDWLAFSFTLREELAGTEWTPVIPAFFTDFVLYKPWNLMGKFSISRNYRFPTLNDLYFLPGGNPDLKHESGFTYDTGISFEVGKSGKYNIRGGISWFDSYVDNWIIWLPTTKGFFSPRNIKQVHAYGVESNGSISVALSNDWLVDLQGTFSWTPSINEGDPVSSADKSVGKQLPYVPEYSATVNGKIQWTSWSFNYKWCYYSRRYTMSSNDISLSGRLPEYFMNNIGVEKVFRCTVGEISLKGSINNLFDEDYLSVLSRPMPGINYEVFLGVKF